MNSKEELLQLIEEIPEAQIPQTITFIKKVIKKSQESKATPDAVEPLDALDAFMATMVNSLTNIMYDLSLDAKRKEEKVMAKRLESYRKKISDGWETYKKNK